MLDGKLDSMQDPPPRGARPTILEQAGERFTEHPTASTCYFSLDQRLAALRRPAGPRGGQLAALDRAAPSPRLTAGGDAARLRAARARGARLRRALDTAECPYGDPTEPPRPRPRAGADRRRPRARRCVGSAVARRRRGRTPRARPALYARTLRRDRRCDARIERRRAKRADRSLSRTPSRRLLRAPTAPFVDRRRPGLDDPLVDGRDSTACGASSDARRRRPRTGAELDRYVVSPPQSYVAPLGPPTVDHLLLRAHGPRRARSSTRVYRNDYSSWRLKEGE